MKLFYKYDYPILPFGHEHDFCSSSMSGAFPFPYYFWWPPVLRLSVCPLLCLSHVSHPKEGRMHVCSSIFGIFRCVFWWLCDSMVWTSCFCGLLWICVCWCFPVLFPGLIDGFAVVFVMDCFFSLSIVWLYFSISLQDIVQKLGLAPALMIFVVHSSISFWCLLLVWCRCIRCSFDVCVVLWFLPVTKQL